MLAENFGAFALDPVQVVRHLVERRRQFEFLRAIDRHRRQVAAAPHFGGCASARSGR